MKKKRLILSILAMLFLLGIMLFSLKVSNIVAEKKLPKIGDFPELCT